MASPQIADSHQSSLFTTPAKTPLKFTVIPSKPSTPEEKPTDKKYFTRNEIALHNSITDLWVSWLGKVYDLTDLAREYSDDPLLTPLLRVAGTDISHWFDENTGDLKTHYNVITNTQSPFPTNGRFLHMPPPIPRSDWNPIESSQTPWWLDVKKYCIGLRSRKTRKIRIVNTLTQREHVLEVCSEEKITAIQDRYTAVNAHAKGYMWKRLGSLLDMNSTLEANHIKDQAGVFEEVGIDEEDWLPVIHLYFSDDLTIA